MTLSQFHYTHQRFFLLTAKGIDITPAVQQVCHDVATPSVSPQPESESEDLKPTSAPIQRTPPASPSPMAQAPPIISPPKIKQPSPEISESISEREVEEEEEEEVMEQPKPM